MDDYLDSPMEDDVFPCKGCGEILEEGKAFELAGNRWHLNCFRCNTCGTLLDSDANLLLLGDGSLICNNCTYSCSACGNKIEDLAILTGDQAFCATCFRCRNCKRKIENLRYARTSQGIFCMSCHESLMARRRKKTKAVAQAKARDKDSPMVEKSLPALPPNAIPPNAFSDERVSPESDTPTELSPRPTRPTYPRMDSSSTRGSLRTARSPERHGDSAKETGLGLPAHNYRRNRNSSILAGQANIEGADGDSFFIPVALDPSPAPSVSSPRSNNEAFDQRKASNDKDYFSKPPAVPDRKNDARSSQASTPHIAFQEKVRRTSSDYEASTAKEPSRKLSKSSKSDRSVVSQASPVASDDRSQKTSHSRKDEFKLQEAPKSKKSAINRSPPQTTSPTEDGASKAVDGNLRKDAIGSKPDSPPRYGPAGTSESPSDAQDARAKDDDKRPSIDTTSSTRTGDTINSKSIPRKEIPAPAATRSVNGKSSRADEPLMPPPRPQVEQKLSDTYMSPRAPPQPPGAPTRETNSAKNGQTSPKVSPKLPRWSSGGDFTMDEDMARILGTDEGSSSILRKVSNAVRHGRPGSVDGMPQPRNGHTRSMSETTGATASPRWPKTPIIQTPQNGDTRDISSPISMNSASQEDSASLKRQLRNSEQRVAELEKQFNSERDLLTLTEKLEEKRKTVSILDTQTEIMIRQLEVLAGYVERAKDTKRPIDPRVLEESAIKEFVQKLDKVKQTMSASIEQLHAERDELVEEKEQAIADRDRALLEFEQLSSKNAQLADMNNDLTHQIQGRFRSQVGSDGKPNGLGIYTNHKATSSTSVHNIDTSSIHTGPTLVGTDVDEPVLEGPRVVQVRKGQAKKFNWKKGGKSVAQNITRVGRAVGAFQTNERGEPRGLPQQGGLNSDNIGLPYNMTIAQLEAPSTTLPNANPNPNGQQNRGGPNDPRPFGFFNRTGKAAPLPKSSTSANVAAAAAAAEPPSTLFGSELVERAEYERRQIPSVVTRCIEEVELRGMDAEGIYRKSGGNGQVKMIQDGFERMEDFDISDPSIDIASVTSVLKQYFRKLPTPLLTFDVYDRVLESASINDPEERCAHLRKTVNMLPQKHRDCLEFLMFHLARVASREPENLMSPKNLAVVFAPTIMRDHSLEREMTDMHAKNLAVQFMVENSNEIFTTDDTGSTTSLLRGSGRTNGGPTAGSSLRQTTTLDDGSESLSVLGRILGEHVPIHTETPGASGTASPSESEETPGGATIKEEDLDLEFDFGGLSLRAFVAQGAGESDGAGGVYRSQTVDEYEQGKTKFEELHRSIRACDDVLSSVETNLTSFRNDLAAVSADIESLQARSTSLNIRLENRKAVEKGLGPVIEELSVSPLIVSKIAEGHVDESWIKVLAELEKKYEAYKKNVKQQGQGKSLEDLGPLLEKLTLKAIERIRDHLVAQIKALRSPHINAQIIQQQNFLKFKDIYTFLHKHQPTLADELCRAYMNTMRWYYLNQFSRYHKALEKIKLHVIDKTDMLGHEDTSRKATVLSSTTKGLGGPPHDAFNLGRRIDLLKTTNQVAISSYLAEEDQATHYLEVPFRNFNIALVDNATAEYTFLASFFAPSFSMATIGKNFNYIFEPTFQLGHSLTKSLVSETYDGLGLLLCIRLNQHLQFELQRRRVPAMDGYVNGAAMMLWPRLQVVMDSHRESVRGLTSALPQKSLPASTAKTTSAAPHVITQRFGQLLHGILALSTEAGDDEPVVTSLGRLRSEMEAFLTRYSQAYFGSDVQGRKRERFLYNNYSLILTIIGDVGAGKLAADQVEHFEGLKRAFQEAA
ncbi:Vacuolar protein sorting-associated protein 52 B [Cytospora mali]|uniref:Vacuolar protein sorting-associated protein 52 B n=1 Tax=Cytospora mali TaxID=578113 RepID=A0A194VGV1_CYTMA|nr:Vacuolar protein sorting-associated protein 52 B [Valsa mali var. pyri (nom. inval.)]